MCTSAEIAKTVSVGKGPWLYVVSRSSSRKFETCKLKSRSSALTWNTLEVP